MAYIKLKRTSLQKNYRFLAKKLGEKNIQWGAVSKILCGNKNYIREVIDMGIGEIHDSRISNLKVVKEINPKIKTVYIKPPARQTIPKIIKYADISCNTELLTIRLLSEEAQRQQKKHQVIIMIEMGDLREGVMGDDLLNFYEKIFELPNIEVIGLGTNLNCLHGVMPSEDKLIQLGLYKQLIESKFNRKIPLVSGGTSVVIPLLLKNKLPKCVNHFRIGEILFFGNNLFTGKNIPGMSRDVFSLHAQIIELIEKPKVPYGELAANPSGEVYEINEEDYGQTSYRAILDLGLLDISLEYLIPEDQKIEISGASSDMLIIEIGNTKRNYKVGSWIKFRLKYMGALGLLNSSYIEKIIE